MSDAASASFTLAGAEVGALAEWEITSSGGGTPVTGSFTVATATDQVTGIDLTGLELGTVTVTVTLTNAAGEGAAATDTATLA